LLSQQGKMKTSRGERSVTIAFYRGRRGLQFWCEIKSTKRVPAAHLRKTSTRFLGKAARVSPSRFERSKKKQRVFHHSTRARKGKENDEQEAKEKKATFTVGAKGKGEFVRIRGSGGG